MNQILLSQINSISELTTLVYNLFHIIQHYVLGSCIIIMINFFVKILSKKKNEEIGTLIMDYVMNLYVCTANRHEQFLIRRLRNYGMFLHE